MSGITSNLRHLRAFQMVARLKNIGKAAAAVHLTQPAVTLAISKLEAQTGAILFERRSRGTYLSPAGKLLAARVDRMFAQMEDALRQVVVEADKAASVAVTVNGITRAQIRALSALAGDPSGSGDEGAASRASNSRTVRDLEKYLGMTLLVPDVDGLSTNPAGSELARRLTVALQEVDYGFEEILADSNRSGGQLRVGASPLWGSCVVGPALNKFSRRFPGVHFEIKTGGCGSLRTGLRQGEIDLVVGLLESEDLADLSKELLVEQPYVLVARARHRLATAERLTLADLEGCDWVVPDKNSARRETFENLISNLRRRPDLEIQTSAISTVKLLLSGSDRLALMTQFEFEYACQHDDLVALPFGPIEPTHNVGFLTRANWVPTPLYSEMTKLIREQVFSVDKATTARRPKSAKRPARIIPDRRGASELIAEPREFE